MEEIVIVKAKRSAIGKFMGSLKHKSALDIATEVAQPIIDENLKNKIDTIYLGNVLQAGQGQNIARQLALRLKLNYECMATTINAVCGSGMQSIILGIQALKLHESNAVLVGGCESMTNAPYLLKNQRSGKRLGNDVVIDSLQHDGLFDHCANMSMIKTAEIVAKKYKISKKLQDEFAYASQQKALKAIKDGKFQEEIVAIDGLDYDEYVKETTLEKIQSFSAIEGENITVANASGINDGAAILILMRKSDALAQNYTPLATINAYATSGCANEEMGFAPYYAIKKLLKNTNTTVNDYDIIEINEAFAAQVLAVANALNINLDKLNVNGGAIALGHPIGASGARIVVSAVHALKNSNYKKALLSLCIGGGNAIALTLEKYEEKI